MLCISFNADGSSDFDHQWVGRLFDWAVISRFSDRTYRRSKFSLKFRILISVFSGATTVHRYSIVSVVWQKELVLNYPRAQNEFIFNGRE
jgi:hypothetical protein